MARSQIKEREQTPDLLNNIAPGAKLPAKAKAKAAQTTAVDKIEPRPPTSALGMLAGALQNPTIDPGKMRELWALYQETEAKQQFHEALLRIDFPPINRDGKIPVSGGRDLRFASFENVHKAVMKLLKVEGFRMSFAPMPADGGGLVVECRLIRGTYEEKCIVPISTAPASRAMNSQQAIGAAIKYASRYGMMYLLNLRSDAAEDRDTDGIDPDLVSGKKTLRPAAGAAAEPEKLAEPGAKITGPQAKELLKVIDDCEIEATRFMEKYKIAAVHQLPVALFTEAVKSCLDYKAALDAKRKKKRDSLR